MGKEILGGACLIQGPHRKKMVFGKLGHLPHQHLTTQNHSQSHL